MSKRRGLTAEDLMHKDFKKLIERYEFFKKLNCSRWSYDASGEYRNEQTGALLKSKGLKPGKADYEFITIRNNIAHYIYLEFKTKTGKQSENQKIFEASCTAENQRYHIVRSNQEAIEKLIIENVIKP